MSDIENINKMGLDEKMKSLKDSFNFKADFTKNQKENINELNLKSLKKWEKHSSEDLNSAIKERFTKEINKIWSWVNNIEANKIFETISKEIESENDPKKKLEKFSEFMDWLKWKVWTDIAEQMKQTKDFEKNNTNSINKNNKDKNDFFEKWQKLRELIELDARKKIERTNENANNARKKWDEEQSKSWEEATKALEDLLKKS